MIATLLLAAKPVTIAASVIGLVWCVPVSIDGRPPKLFLVDSGLNLTVIPGGRANPVKEAHTMSIGGLDLGRVTINKVDAPLLAALEAERREGHLDGPPVGGAIGMDLLSKMAIGFDVVEQKIALWPGGKLSASEAGDWVSGAPPWDPSASGAKPRVIDIQRSFGDSFGFSGSVGGKSVGILLDTGQETFALRGAYSPLASKKFDMHELVGFLSRSQHERRLTSETKLGVDDCPWLFYYREDYGNLDQLVGKPDAAIGLQQLRSRRTIIDFPAGKLYLEPTSTDQSLSMFASWCLGLPLRIDGDTLRIGPVYPLTEKSELREMEGAHVLTFGGIRGKAIIQALRGASSDDADLLLGLMHAVVHGTTLSVDDKGTNRTIELRGTGGP